MLSINVRLFALYRERLKMSELTLMVPEGSTVRDLVSQLAQEHPNIGPLLEHTAIAVNEVYAENTQILAESDELALLPPVSGGSI
jgi:molybdopterin synthase catalytic subunit|tara:strand:- start:118 stop:372 length:255 start_codon:yes stop_codon:yes gene_type:complete